MANIDKKEKPEARGGAGRGQGLKPNYPPDVKTTTIRRLVPTDKKDEIAAKFDEILKQYKK